MDWLIIVLALAALAWTAADIERARAQTAGANTHTQEDPHP
jgi:hypothetical protein